ncbi:phytanoyl-CoA dioxygenase family protein [Acidovorax sp. SUPP3334]|uniref:phytanoyl-CoA dioxygenase family protein n=1 Tax=Acidovorax sp. SUPP3334 TaxID=2920881 RepID=UPI0023DE61FF|nr:phytanoyl-CoA dioxygenase family protein [Acidovorax sp. SUPP3334]GKT21239.1 phytanoyl-CoA dioxygenase family protein [Acidovorax sp. SUPP3334]
MPLPTLTSPDSLCAASERGALQVPYLKRCWSRWRAARKGRAVDGDNEFHRTQIVLGALGLGLEQTMHYALREAQDFATFEDWIVRTAGQPDASTIARIQALVDGGPAPEAVARLHAQIDAAAPVLDADDLACWNEHGFVIVREAVSAADSAEAAQAVWDTVGALPHDVESWYAKAPRNIMVQRFQHPAFERNRRSPRIHKVFAQLWGTADLWRTTDRCGFNVPERPGHPYGGQGLHWDVSLEQPIPFSTQGILYLTDTPPEQGALTVVPGFHRKIGDWLADLPQGAAPRSQDFSALGARAIGAGAGDLVIWHQALPHGASPNRGALPRLVQYINMFPAELTIHPNWR